MEALKTPVGGSRHKRIAKDVKRIYAGISDKTLSDWRGGFLNQDRLTYKMDDGDTILHLCAREGYLKKIEECLLTSEAMAVAGRDGENVYTTAIGAGRFEDIPKKLHGEKMLLAKNKNGIALIVDLTNAGMLPEVERDAFTLNSLAALDHEMNNILILAAQKRHIYCIPDRLITHELVTAANMDLKNAIDFISDPEEKDRVMHIIGWGVGIHDDDLL